jgi:hypothetical protein
MKKSNVMSMAIVTVFLLILFVLPCWAEKPSKKTKEVNLLDYEVIRNSMNNMTDVHWDEYVNYLKGKRIHWKGWIYDIQEQWFGGYKILIDMDPPGSLSVQDVYIEDQPRETAIKFYKNQKVEFSGNIKSVIKVLGSCAVILENVEINPAQK